MPRKKGSDIQRKKPKERRNITKRKSQSGCGASFPMPTLQYWQPLCDKGLTVFIIGPRLTLITPLAAIIRIGNSMNGVVPQGAWPAPPIPPAAEPKKRIAPIASVADVRDHMVRIFKEARRGDCKIEDASRLIFMLGQIQKCFEASELERRLTALEQSE